MNPVVGSIPFLVSYFPNLPCCSYRGALPLPGSYPEGGACGINEPPPGLTTRIALPPMI